jgi:hypothetical protein
MGYNSSFNFYLCIEMAKKAILIPPWNTYGDTFSIIGLIYFLLDYYTYLYVYMEDKVLEYFQHYFKFDPLFNDRIFIIDKIENFIDKSTQYEYDIINTRGWWTRYDYNSSKIEHYFNDANPFYDKYLIPEKYINKPNVRLPVLIREINHLVYYKIIGLNNSVRMDYFNYVRNSEIEETYYTKLIDTEHYACVNVPQGIAFDYNPNRLKCINISDQAPCVGYLCKVIENASEIHLVEGNNTNFIYHCMYKGIIKVKCKIKFHIWARNREWTNYNLDWAWKMMSEPKLDNWEFLFEKPSS